MKIDAKQFESTNGSAHFPDIPEGSVVPILQRSSRIYEGKFRRGASLV